MLSLPSSILLLGATVWAAEMTLPSASRADSASSFWSISNLWSNWRSRNQPAAMPDNIETYSTNVDREDLTMSFMLVHTRPIGGKDAETLATEQPQVSEALDSASASVDSSFAPPAPPPPPAPELVVAETGSLPPRLPRQPAAPSSAENEITKRRKLSRTLSEAVLERAQKRRQALGIVDEISESTEGQSQPRSLSPPSAPPSTSATQYSEKEIKANRMRARAVMPLKREQMGAGKGEMFAELKRRVSERNLNSAETETLVPLKSPLSVKQPASKPVALSRTLSRNSFTNNPGEKNLFLEMINEYRRRQEKQKQGDSTVITGEARPDPDSQLLTDDSSLESAEIPPASMQMATSPQVQEMTEQLSELSIVSGQAKVSRLKGKHRVEQKRVEKEKKRQTSEVRTEETLEKQESQPEQQLQQRPKKKLANQVILSGKGKKKKKNKSNTKRKQS